MGGDRRVLDVVDLIVIRWVKESYVGNGVRKRSEFVIRFGVLI